MTLILVNREDDYVPQPTRDQLATHRQIVAVVTDAMGEVEVQVLKDNIGGLEIRDVSP